jgi:hypothetical protein
MESGCVKNPLFEISRSATDSHSLAEIETCYAQRVTSIPAFIGWVVQKRYFQFNQSDNDCCFIGSFALSDFSEIQLPTVFHMVECNGTEDNVTECLMSAGDGGCQDRNDASVICQG